MPVPDNKLPLYLLTGFLGSGKTSLLRQCLQSPGFSDTAVLVNEFGDIGLDHELVEASDEETVVLKGGCVCCTIREDLAKTIRRLADLRREQRIRSFSRLIIETSGLADPVPILITLKSDPRITRLFGFRGAIVAVDAVFGARTLLNHRESARQVVYANRAVITKCDLATIEEIDHVETTVRRINQSASVRRSDNKGLSPEELFDDLHYDPQALSDGPDSWLGVAGGNNVNTANYADLRVFSDSHIDHFSSFSWEFEHEIDWTVFGIWLTMLLHAHGDRILRVKGILNVSGADAPVAIHGVQHMVHPPLHMKRWQHRNRHSRLVFVVRDLSPGIVRESFDAFNKLGRRTGARNGQSRELPVGAGRTIGGRPRRRPSAPAWIKG